MLRRDKNIVHALCKRETGGYPSPIRSNPKLIRRIIESKDSLYSRCWNKKSKKPISFEDGYLFFDHYSTIYTVYGPKCYPTKAFNMQTGRAMEKIIDIILYTQPVVKEPNYCICNEKKCLCLKRFFILLTKDQWLIQCNFETGVVIKEMYVESYNHDYGFGYCCWNVYGSQFTLISHLNPDRSKVVGYMAVFTVFPSSVFQFKCMFELSQDVFGKPLRSVNVSEQLFIAAMSGTHVKIYSFEDVLKEGCYVSPEGNDFSGININFRIQRAPPVLFSVQCKGQSVQFGGYPYHCLFPKHNRNKTYKLRSLSCGKILRSSYIECDNWYSDSAAVSFHPDFSNRVIVQNLKSLHCCNIINDDNSVDLKEAFVIKFPDIPYPRSTSGCSNFGRKLKQISYFTCERSIFAMCYEDEMDVIGILGAHPNDPFLHGYVMMFDGSSGKELKTLNLSEQLNENSEYELSIDLDVIVITMKNFNSSFEAFLYRLEEGGLQGCSSSSPNFDRTGPKTKFLSPLIW